jgi:hypothetical protein
MIDVLSSMHLVLREAGFITRLASIERSSIVCFEDEILSGFGCVFANPRELLAEWKAMEMALLTHFSPSLRAAREKAWNIYCIFLCASDADAEQNREVRWIEEDLERTRKIAACGLLSRDDIVRALLPILPLQYKPALRAEDANDRLQTRIRGISPKASQIVLDETISTAEVIRLLGEST